MSTDKQVIVRPAEVKDIPGIVALDASAYDDITTASTDDPFEMFRLRLKNSPDWFWVAEVGGDIEGLLSAQPSRYAPEDFVSWEQCTANGTLAGTSDPKSDVMYVAALTVSPLGSRLEATDKLMVAGVKKAIVENKRIAFFSARMPDYHKFCDTMSPNEYYAATTSKNGREVPLDPQLRFYEGIGGRRERLVENGFAADWQSCGFAVLFTFAIPFHNWPAKRMWASLFGAVAERPRLFAFFSRFA